MEISLEKETLRLTSGSSEIYHEDGTHTFITGENWAWLLANTPSAPLDGERVFRIDTSMYELYGKIDISSLLETLRVVQDISCNSYTGRAPAKILGFAAITCVFLNIPDLPVQLEMYKRRYEYLCMHLDIGKATTYGKDMPVMSYKGKMSNYMLSDFNGTFLPFATARIRKQCVYPLGKLNALNRYIYRYLCDNEMFQDYLWGLVKRADLPSIIGRLLNYFERDELVRVPDLGLFNITQIDMQKIYMMYTDPESIEMLHTLYPYTRQLFLSRTLTRSQQLEFLRKNEYRNIMLAQDWTLIQYLQKQSVGNIIQHVDPVRALYAAILFNEKSWLPDVSITEEMVALVESMQDRISPEMVVTLDKRYPH